METRTVKHCDEDEHSEPLRRSPADPRVLRRITARGANHQQDSATTGRKQERLTVHLLVNFLDNERGVAEDPALNDLFEFKASRI